jgi:hypothetical protein
MLKRLFLTQSSQRFEQHGSGDLNKEAAGFAGRRQENGNSRGFFTQRRNDATNGNGFLTGFTGFTGAAYPLAYYEPNGLWTMCQKHTWHRGYSSQVDSPFTGFTGF